jgi:hypothetical protein
MKYIKIAIVALVFSIIAFAIVKNCNRDSKLKSNHNISNGRIVDVLDRAKSGFGVEYTFLVNNKEYQGSTILIVRSRDGLIGKNVPVIYWPDNPNINRLLFFSYDWEKYNLQFPDSMNWVNQYAWK